MSLYLLYVFRKAADQGHAHASYNLAIGHLRGMNTGLKPGLVLICCVGFWVIYFLLL